MASTNRTTYAILGSLTLRPMSGYDIKKGIEGSIANFWSESYGQIYPILKRLADEGAVERTDEPIEGKRPRHVYAITDKGRERLVEWLREPAEPPPVRIELLLKLFFGAHVERETSKRQIEEYRARMTTDLERYRDIADSIGCGRQDHPHAPYWLLTLRFGVRDREAHIAWCDEALELLENMPDESRRTAPAGETENLEWPNISKLTGTQS
jgi:DNA-binding PadR family transcriptional regulator